MYKIAITNVKLNVVSLTSETIIHNFSTKQHYYRICENHFVQFHFVVCDLIIWTKGPQLTYRDYSNHTLNSRDKYPIETLDCRIGRFYRSYLGRSNRSNARIPHFLNSHDLSVNSYGYTKHARALCTQISKNKNYFAKSSN